MCKWIRSFSIPILKLHLMWETEREIVYDDGLYVCLFWKRALHIQYRYAFVQCCCKITYFTLFQRLQNQFCLTTTKAHMHIQTHKERERKESITIMQTNCHISRSKFAYGIFNTQNIFAHSICLCRLPFACVCLSQAYKIYIPFYSPFPKCCFLLASALFYSEFSRQCVCVWVAQVFLTCYLKLPNRKKITNEQG